MVCGGGGRERFAPRRRGATYYARSTREVKWRASKGSLMADERPAESTRDRVRALVREVLKNAAPAEESDASSSAPSSPSRPAPPTASAAGGPPLARVVNVAASEPRAAE